MKKTLFIAFVLGNIAAAQVVIPDGTRIRVRLEQNLSSETAEVGQPVDFVVTEEVRVGDAVVIANGARATGEITEAHSRRRMGRAGKLDFSIDRVMTVNGNWLRLRYTPVKNKGEGKALTTGIATAGIAFLFPPAAPVALLIKGKDIVVNRGRTFEVFSDESVYVASAAAAGTPMVARPLPQAQTSILRNPAGASVNNTGLASNVSVTHNPTLAGSAAMMGGAGANQAVVPAAQGGATMVNVTATSAGADIEIDGVFVGNAPSSVTLAPGLHRVSVRLGSQIWQRDVQVMGGNITLHADFEPAVRRAAR